MNQKASMQNNLDEYTEKIGSKLSSKNSKKYNLKTSSKYEKGNF